MDIKEKLLMIQGELKAPKGQYNNYGGYKYRSCEDILEAVKPLLIKYNATLTVADEIILIGERYYIKATARIFDTETENNCFTVSAYAREPEDKKGMDHSQITGTASSYARKYALNGLFLIDDTKDADTDEYKKQNNIDVLIVNQMLLTGFDAPRLKKLYLGRSLDGHDLLQALTRVNRPYKDFKYGYVVDFVDIKENFDSTNDRYLKELNRTAEGSETEPVPPIGETIIVDREEILSKIKDIRSELFNYNCENYEEFRKQIDAIEDKQRLYQLRNHLNDAKAIMNQIRILGDEELKTKINKLPLDALPTLATEVSHKIERLNLLHSTETKTDINAIINLAISELEFEFSKKEAEEYGIITLQHHIDEANEVMFAKLRRLLDEEIPLHEIPERMKALNDRPSWLTNFNYENFYYL